MAEVYAYDTAAGTYKTGDSANIALRWTKDGTNAATTNAVAEVDATNSPGLYKVTMTAAEATCTAGQLSGKSSTATTIVIIGNQYHFDGFTTVLPVGTIAGLAIIDNGALQAATGTTAQLRSAANFNTNNNPVGMTLAITSGTGFGQSRVITAYTNSTDTATVDTWTTTPAAADTYIVYPTAPGSTSVPTPTNVLQWNSTAVSTPATAGIPDVNVKNWGNTAIATANVRSNLVQILGTAPTEGGAGRLAGSFTTLLDVASPALTVASVNQTGDSYGIINGANTVETGLSFVGTLRLTAAAIAGKASGLATTTAVFRNAVQDSKARITATVDVDGNRTAVVTDVT